MKIIRIFDWVKHCYWIQILITVNLVLCCQKIFHNSIVGTHQANTWSKSEMGRNSPWPFCGTDTERVRKVMPLYKVNFNWWNNYGWLMALNKNTLTCWYSLMPFTIPLGGAWLLYNCNWFIRISYVGWCNGFNIPFRHFTTYC